MLVTNLFSAVIIGNRVTWEDVEGVHIGTVSEIWEDQDVAVCVGREYGMDFTAFVPVKESV